MIQLSFKDDIARIELNDGKANVISKEVAEEFSAALAEAAEKAKATYIIGNGDKFSAGFDLKTVKSSGDAQVAMVSAGFKLLYDLYTHPQPILAACNGHAMGMGAFILLCSDNRIGVKGDYNVGLPETAAGMPFTPLLISIVDAELNPMFKKSAALQSQMCNAETAITANFLDMIVDSDQLESTVVAGAKQLMQLPKSQYGDNKKMIRAQTLDLMEAELKGLGML